MLVQPSALRALLNASPPATPSLRASLRGPGSGLLVGFLQTPNTTHPIQGASLSAAQLKVIFHVILYFIASSFSKWKVSQTQPKQLIGLSRFLVSGVVVLSHELTYMIANILDAQCLQ